MLDINEVKIEVFIPDDYVDALRDELGKVHVGVIGKYDHCISVTAVRGYWRPLEGANPYDGEVGKISQGNESKVEVNCRVENIKDALEAIRRVHPYETPLVNLVPLVNHLFNNDLGENI